MFSQNYDTLFVADAGNSVVRAINMTSRIISTFAGQSGVFSFSGENVSAKSATFNGFKGLAVQGTQLYIADTTNGRIRVVNTTSGNISTYAGTGNSAYGGEKGFATNAALSKVMGLATDAQNKLIYFSDFDNRRVRMVNISSSIVSLVAGNGQTSYSGDGGFATLASFSGPASVALNNITNVLFVADGHVVRMINLTSNIISTVAGTGVAGYNGDGILATSAQLNSVGGLAIDVKNMLLYVSETQSHRIRVINLATNIISTFAGTGRAGYSSDQTDAGSADLKNPKGVTLDELLGILYIADSQNHRIRAVSTSTRKISTLLGTGQAQTLGDGSFVALASTNNPISIAIDSQNRLFYFCESSSHVIRMINLTSSIVQRFAGTGEGGTGLQEGEISTTVTISSPTAILVDALSNVIYFADSGNSKIRMLGNFSCSIGASGNFPACAYCQSGYYSDTHGSSTCKACFAGSFSPNIGAVAQGICQLCSVGSFSTAGASLCNACPSGSYSNVTGAVQCYPCGIGMYTTTVGSPSNNSCIKCAPGTASNIIIASSCSPCSAGYYSDAAGVAVCKPCTRGTFASNFGSTICVPCADGTVSVVEASTTCQVCPPGTYSSNDRTSCTLCPQGTFSQRTGMNSSETCVPCAIGYYSASNGSSSQCLPCVAGTFSTSTGSSQVCRIVLH